MDPFVFMLFLLGFILLMARMLPGNEMGAESKCPHCGGRLMMHYPNCKRAK